MDPVKITFSVPSLEKLPQKKLQFCNLMKPLGFECKKFEAHDTGKKINVTLTFTPVKKKKK